MICLGLEYEEGQKGYYVDSCNNMMQQ